MNNKEKILILNTGGTFNKVYNPITGTLDIEKNNNSIENIVQLSKIKDIKIDGILFKDSLQITTKDRETLVEYIKNSKFKKIIIVHGTDTIDKTAKFLDRYIKDKTIILTAAMKPYSIEKVEATANLMIGYGNLLEKKRKGIFISIHGMVKKYNKIKKNRTLGVFECQ